MNKYSTGLTYCEGNFDMEIITNYVFEAENDKEALHKSETVSSWLSSFIDIYYDKFKHDIVINITKNAHFDVLTITKFTFYDESKGDYQTLTLEDGKSLYPVANEDCFVSVTKERFLELLQQHYENYLIDKQKLTFDSISYFQQKIS